MTIDAPELVAGLQPYLGASRWLIGLSGGLDSVVLLHLLAQLRTQYKFPALLAVHVNHQLNPDALEWSDFARTLCGKLKIDIDVQTVAVEQVGKGLEAAARDARYRVFESLLQRGEVVLLAHHLDDQVETFFLRLLRGAGTRGLSGMPQSRGLGLGTLYRPLLGFRRQQLQDYADQHRLKWVEDASNADTRHDRNYLRHAVLPLLEQRWPGYRGSVRRGITAVGEAEDLLQGFYAERMRAARGSHYATPTLAEACLSGNGIEVSARILRLWLQELGLPLPGRDQLLEYISQLRHADSGQTPECRTASYVLRRYREQLYACALDAQVVLPVGQPLRVGSGLALPGVGSVQLIPAISGGIASRWADELQVGFRDGGERCQPCGRDHSQTLKKLLQEYAVPPWWRDRVPLLVVGDALVAVGDLWVCEGYQAGPDETGYEVRWGRNSPA
ncbi:tRNA lysidine(34) synthetase TilS [Halieaceae bacterium IMCC14734]|uniref:tRNA(Ile)-lysidine synthase n=1 Tax=Candidatus Litorirhabdus singularis TaxID=2518993 RepID=A0ABT3TL52_9GAMM|nr:tRNA lysidine(34) synthetase TilS [Candidatus Litorirhabdus singularis]MCX2982139.1 tRNA lysidine(34) synthetase TilS [Candidatus Litorirhabdus singularis]